MRILSLVTGTVTAWLQGYRGPVTRSVTGRLQRLQGLRQGSCSGGLLPPPRNPSPLTRRGYQGACNRTCNQGSYRAFLDGRVTPTVRRLQRKSRGGLGA